MLELKEGYGYTPTLIGMCNERGAFLCGDTRMVTIDGDKAVFMEDCRKVFKNMLRYTYDRVRDKTFPKADRWIMPKSIWEQAVNAHTVIVRANEIRVENAGDARTRLLLQKEASGYLCAMMSLIDTAHMCGVISDDRAEYWSGLANKTLVLCKAWHKKEREKLKAYLTQESAG